jgi:hypothetical protein
MGENSLNKLHRQSSSHERDNNKESQLTQVVPHSPDLIPETRGKLGKKGIIGIGKSLQPKDRNRRKMELFKVNSDGSW